MDRGLLEGYLAEGLSLERIGELVGRDRSTVGYWLGRYGLRAVNRDKHAAKGAIDRETLTKLVEEGRSRREIADEVNRSLGTVRHWLRRYGLATRQTERRRELARARREGITRLTCPRHGETEFVLESSGRLRCLKCRSAYVARRRRRIKETLVEEAGGRCGLCGYDRCVAALHFHHTNPVEKSFGLASEGSTRSLEAAREEAQKCVLLCSNCHAEVETGVVALA